MDTTQTKQTFIILCILLLTLTTTTLTTHAQAKNHITLDFYYASTCSHCQTKIPIITAIEHNYTDTVQVRWKELTNATNMTDWQAHGSPAYPVVIIQNTTIIPSNNITYTTIATILDNLIHNLGPDYFQDQTVIYLPIIGRLDTKTLSLPILTVTLGALDSINPCSFFILFFLLGILASLHSRRTMLLVGSIFILFSALIYLTFMFLLFNTLAILQNIQIISIAAGAIALTMGILNIKDFFAFKQGPSLTISDDKRPLIFRRMRRLAHATYLPAILAGAIFLAITVNFYELLCTLGFPLVYTTQLATYHLPTITYYLYLILYNIVYVIPLIIILIAFMFTLGKTRLSEWRARQLKLLSGIMITSFGILFLIDFMLLQNVLVPILLLIISVTATLIISEIWKKRSPPQPEGPDIIVAEEAGQAGTTDSETTNPPAPPQPGSNQNDTSYQQAEHQTPSQHQEES
jgi:hypothetical protein